MNGNGNTTTYDVDVPTFQYTASTTEFDDALIRRNVVTREDAVVAKGATRRQAERVVAEARENAAAVAAASVGATTTRNWYDDDDKNNNNGGGGSSSDDDDEFFGDDDGGDEFMARYRQRRIEELRQQHNEKSSSSTPTLYNSGSGVLRISRDEWHRHVNEASRGGRWVVVCLTSSDTERTGCVERACQQLAELYGAIDDESEYAATGVKFVAIASHQAVPNFPQDSLPCLFCYCDGACQHQLLRLNHTMDAPELEELLRSISVLN